MFGFVMMCISIPIFLLKAEILISNLGCVPLYA
jgi:hypothetical protein